jgi:hypothetical protein
MLFPAAKAGGASAHVNRILGNVAAKVGVSSVADPTGGVGKRLALMKSHSPRSGAPSTAAQREGVELHWLLQRGGWQVDRWNKFFLYLFGTERGESRVGRTLSDWPDATHGGMCPILTDLPQEEQSEAFWYAAQLIPSAELCPDVRSALVSVLLLHYTAVKEELCTCLPPLISLQTFWSQ